MVPCWSSKPGQIQRGSTEGPLGGRPPALLSSWKLGGKLSWGRKEPAGLGVTPHRLERYVAWNLNTGCEAQRKGWGRERTKFGTVNSFVR